MPITLSPSELPGIKERDSIGDYLIDIGKFIESESDEDGGIISTIWSITKGVSGFLWKAASSVFKLAAFTFTSVWGLLVNTTQFVMNFDFGVSDAVLDQQAVSQWFAVANQTGGLIGQSLGYLVGGVIPGLLIFKFNEMAGLAVLREVGEEALDELSASIYALTQTLVKTVIRGMFIYAFKGVRRWLRRPGNPFYALVPASLREAWEKGKSWRISQQIEEKIESIENPVLENFVEELVEEFGDSVIEAGYVVSGALDRYVAEQRRKTVDQVVEVTPNRGYPNEKFLLAGPEDEIRTTLPLALAHYEVLDQRDVGVVSTIDPAQMFVKAQPLELYVKIEWRSARGNEGPRPAYQISSVKRSKVGDYNFIRQIAGGQNGYLWGPWKAIAQMSDGHTITSYAATQDGAEGRVRALAQLSEADIETMNVTRENKADKRLTITGLQKDLEQVFPHRIIITNRKYFSTPQPGAKASKRGYYVPLSARLSINSPTKPPDWDIRVAELLAGPTASNPG